ncbi:MAG: hypothetical protein ACOX8U_06420 [Bradymonadia bacterium]|jgi:hypothetical protein
MDALEILRHKVSDTNASEFDIKLALEEAEQYIKNYCHISRVPKELRFTHANMASDLIHAQFGSQSEAIKPHEIVSIQVDDVSIHTSPDARAHKINLDDLFYDYKAQLNKFRRLRWS